MRNVPSIVHVEWCASISEVLRLHLQLQSLTAFTASSINCSALMMFKATSAMNTTLSVANQAVIWAMAIKPVLIQVILSLMTLRATLKPPALKDSVKGTSSC